MYMVLSKKDNTEWIVRPAICPNRSLKNISEVSRFSVCCASLLVAQSDELPNEWWLLAQFVLCDWFGRLVVAFHHKSMLLSG